MGDNLFANALCNPSQYFKYKNLVHFKITRNLSKTKKQNNLLQAIRHRKHWESLWHSVIVIVLFRCGQTSTDCI